MAQIRETEIDDEGRPVGPRRVVRDETRRGGGGFGWGLILGVLLILIGIGMFAQNRPTPSQLAANQLNQPYASSSAYPVQPSPQ
ncbi:MAG: hypothetical protein ABUS48_03885 [Pseudomonadota bacterium]